MTTTQPQIYIIHENEEWVIPLRHTLEKIEAPYKEWFLNEGIIQISEEPPTGVFYNRMSASSHTRGHRFGPEYTANVLAWLKSYDRKIVNGPDAIRLEVSKVAQYAELKKYDITFPKTYAAIGKNQILTAAKNFTNTPFITKHNRAGKGLGVKLFRTLAALETYVNSEEFDDPIDGITLLQEYIESPDSSITRVEFIGSELVYAVKIDTSQGFELCPADSCQIDDAYCPTTKDKTYKFSIIKNFGEKEFEKTLIDKYRKLMENNDIQIAGIEFIQDKKGNSYTYDINTNTNYNQDAESRSNNKEGGMDHIAKYLFSLL
jgi:hypothetical protein